MAHDVVPVVIAQCESVFCSKLLHISSALEAFLYMIAYTYKLEFVIFFDFSHPVVYYYNCFGSIDPKG